MDRRDGRLAHLLLQRSPGRHCVLQLTVPPHHLTAVPPSDTHGINGTNRRGSEECSGFIYWGAEGKRIYLVAVLFNYSFFRAISTRIFFRAQKKNISTNDSINTASEN